MHAAAERLEFAPPPTPGMLRALMLALLAHGVLLLALTWGVSWHRQTTLPSIEAELWSSVPQQAAPKLEEPEPTPPTPAVAPPPPAPAPAVSDAEIALAKEKKRQEEDKQRKAQLEALRQEKLKKEKREREQAELEKKRKEQEALKKKEKDKPKEAPKKKDDDAKLQKLIDEQRKEQLKRLAGLAGASGSASASGSALQSSGPSANYGGKIVARIRPNIVFTDEIVGNPRAEVEVRTAPDGTIIGRRLLKSSGNPKWDEAVLKAIDKTDTLPRDSDGRVPPTLEIGLRPRD